MSKGSQPPDDLAVSLSWPHSVEPPTDNHNRRLGQVSPKSEPSDLQEVISRLDALSAQVQALTDLVQSLASRRTPVRRRTTD